MHGHTDIMASFIEFTEKLHITLDADIMNTDIPILDLKILPLRFAPRELCESLENGGRIFWSCRYKKYIFYTSKSKHTEYAVSLQSIGPISCQDGLNHLQSQDSVI